MYVNIEIADLKACHALGPLNFEGPPAFITKFIYYDQKDSVVSQTISSQLYQPVE